MSFKSFAMIAALLVVVSVGAGMDASSMGTPDRTRRLQRYVRTRRSLMKQKMRLEEESEIVRGVKEAALQKMQTARDELVQLKKTCASIGGVECAGLRMKMRALAAAKVEVEHASKAVRGNFVGFENSKSQLEEVGHRIDSLMRAGRAAPSVEPHATPCSGAYCKIFCKHGRCYCYCLN